MAKKSDSNEIELSLEINYLRDKVSKLESENSKLIQVIKDNDLTDEVANVSTLSDEENICVNEIRRLKELSDQSTFTQEDAKTFDILYKNLRAIRGMSAIKKEKKTKPLDREELFKIVKGADEK